MWFSGTYTQSYSLTTPSFASPLAHENAICRIDCVRYVYEIKCSNSFVRAWVGVCMYVYGTLLAPSPFNNFINKVCCETSQDLH